MKKHILKWNIFIYAVLYSLSLLRLGFLWGECYPNDAGLGGAVIFPLFYLILLIVSLFHLRDWEYLGEARYWIMGGVTLGLISATWAFACLSYSRGSMPEASLWDIVIYPAILFVLSTIVFALDIYCAIQTRKENTDT